MHWRVHAETGLTGDHQASPDRDCLVRAIEPQERLGQAVRQLGIRRVRLDERLERGSGLLEAFLRRLQLAQLATDLADPEEGEGQAGVARLSRRDAP